MSQRQNRSRSRVALVATGGTIASIGHDRLDLAFYDETGQTVDASGLLDRVPETIDSADIIPIDIFRILSSAITVDDWLRLASTVAKLLGDDEFDGVVVTHGTNTMEETAYFLSLVTPQAKPTVVVGGMRPLSAYGADGDLNLINAVRVASCPAMQGHGTVVCMAGEVFAAKSAIKGDTYRPDAFTAGRHGPVASIDPAGQVLVHHPPPDRDPKQPRFSIDGRADLPRVEVAISYATQDGATIRAMIERGVDGIISAAPGAGKPTPDERAALAEAIGSGIAVVQATRITSGWVVASATMRDQGIVASRDLSPFKSRILLCLALARDPRPSYDELQALFDMS